MILKPIAKGLLAMSVLLAIYFSVIIFISGYNFAMRQFYQYWYFIIGLALGFGIQIGLYTYLKDAIYERASKGAMAVSAAASTIAMISCCAHYLANILPILGIAGALTIVAQYQIQLFWIGLAFNALGILYILNRIIKFKKQL